MNAIIYAVVCVAIFGTFLAVRGIFYFIKHDDHPTAYFAGLGLLVLPVIIWYLASIPMSKLSVWIVMPAILFMLTWLSIGYVVESKRRKEVERIKAGLPKPNQPQQTKGFVLRDVVCLLIGVGLWVYGNFVGFANKTLETSVLCICLFFLTISVGSLWRCRYAIFGESGTLKGGKK